ncbi:ferric reductase NAD binding domain-containing protein [Blastocladiella britannica]|nr:ferric reductase NAD binding domain-containing protein [Blastocladiella britannica]
MPGPNKQEAFVSVRLDETGVVVRHKRRDGSGMIVQWKNWFVNEGTKRFCFLLFIGAQLYLFINTFLMYAVGTNWHVYETLVGPGIATAKSAAACLNLDSGIILFPVCRTAVSLLRVTFLNNIIPFDKNITFHRYVAYAIVFFTWVHVTAHYWNYRMVGIATTHSAEWYAYVSGPGLTGQVATVALFLMATSAAESVRRAHHEIFWYTHHLFLLYFASLLPHGAYCFVKADKPPLCAVGGNFWKYFVGGGALYALERLGRELRARRDTTVSKVIYHPGKVLELQIQKPSAPMRAGQYIWLYCPAVSPFQWHPFTLTSAPQEGFLSVHVRIVGDWTTELAMKCGVTFSDSDKTMQPRIGSNTGLPTIMIDGPYGAASEDWMNFEAIMLVGAGIGVTPFASILKSIYFMKQQNDPRIAKLRKVHFVWVCRDIAAFEWFQSLLLLIEREFPDLVEIHTYLTGALKPDQINNVMIHDMSAPSDALTGLQSFTYYGRPSWDAIFTGLKVSHPDIDFGVFFCGPKVLSETLHIMCNKHTDSGDVGVRFYYNKENF